MSAKSKKSKSAKKPQKRSLRQIVRRSVVTVGMILFVIIFISSMTPSPRLSSSSAEIQQSLTPITISPIPQLAPAAPTAAVIADPRTPVK
jgi:hypothetical protein